MELNIEKLNNLPSRGKVSVMAALMSRKEKTPVGQQPIGTARGRLENIGQRKKPKIQKQNIAKSSVGELIIPGSHVTLE